MVSFKEKLKGKHAYIEGARATCIKNNPYEPESLYFTEWLNGFLDSEFLRKL
jgi:hypothetical protein